MFFTQLKIKSKMRFIFCIAQVTRQSKTKQIIKPIKKGIDLVPSEGANKPLCEIYETKGRNVQINKRFWGNIPVGALL